jgi:hypothetical protein
MQSPSYPQPPTAVTSWILCFFSHPAREWHPDYQQKIVVQCFAYSASITGNSSAKNPKDFMYLEHHAPVYSGTTTASKVVVSPLQTVWG